MGCDIHSIIERQDHAGVWRRSKVQVFPNPYYSDRRPLDDWNCPFEARPFHDRDYALFAMLADVRNQADYITPIAEPRGVPDNATKWWKKYVGEDDYSDIHSATYFTLAELEEYLGAGLFKQKVEQRGVIDIDQYVALKTMGYEPDHWSGGVGGGSTMVARDVVYDAMPYNDERLKVTHVETSWTRVIDREPKIREVLEIAKGFARQNDFGERDLNSVRIMIGFDN